MPKITKLSRQPSLQTMTLNRLSSASLCCDWQASCGGFAVQRRWKLDCLRFKPRICATISKTATYLRILVRLSTRCSGRPILPATPQSVSDLVTVPHSGMKPDAPSVEFARCFLRLANLPNFALDRLSRYEATLWRQVGRILFALDALDRRKPQERGRRFRHGSWQGLPPYETGEV